MNYHGGKESLCLDVQLQPDKKKIIPERMRMNTSKATYYILHNRKSLFKSALKKKITILITKTEKPTHKVLITDK